MLVHLQNISVKFEYQGHEVKVKVTGAKKLAVFAILCIYWLMHYQTSLNRSRSFEGQGQGHPKVMVKTENNNNNNNNN